MTRTQLHINKNQQISSKLIKIMIYYFTSYKITGSYSHITRKKLLLCQNKVVILVDRICHPIELRYTTWINFAKQKNKSINLQ